MTTRSTKPCSSGDSIRKCSGKRDTCKQTLRAGRSVRSEGGLLSTLSLELGQDSAGEGETRDLVALGKLKADTLGVVVDGLDLGNLEGEPALFSTKESLFGLSDDHLFHFSSRGGGSAEVPVAGTSETDGASSVQQRVGTSRSTSLSGIAADVLMEVSNRDAIVMRSTVAPEGMWWRGDRM